MNLSTWIHEHGASLCPSGRPDTFGEGMRAAKEQVRHLLTSDVSARAVYRLIDAAVEISDFLEFDDDLDSENALVDELRRAIENAKEFY